MLKEFQSYIKTPIRFAALISITASGVNEVLAQTATPLDITSGFNWDLVANGSGPSAGSVTGAIDPAGNVFYDSTYLSSHSGGGSGVFPSGGTVIGNSGNQYNLASASGNNSLFLSGSEASGTLNLSYSSPSPLGVVYVLGTSANGSTLLNYTLNFSGGTTFNGSFTFADWYDQSQSGEITGLSRVDLQDNYGNQVNSFSLYDNAIIIPDVDQNLTLQSISFNFAGLSSAATIFAVSGAAPVPEPTSAALVTVGIIGAGWLARRNRKYRG